MQSGQSLIDKASEVCGGDAALARRMGISRALISLMRSGDRKITPETAAELADIAGDDAREAAIAAIIEGARGTRRESTLRAILGKALAAGVAAMLVFSYKEDSTSTTETIAKSETPVNLSIHRIYWMLRQIKRKLGVFVLRTNRALAFG